MALFPSRMPPAAAPDLPEIAPVASDPAVVELRGEITRLVDRDRVLAQREPTLLASSARLVTVGAEPEPIEMKTTFRRDASGRMVAIARVPVGPAPPPPPARDPGLTVSQAEQELDALRLERRQISEGLAALRRREPHAAREAERRVLVQISPYIESLRGRHAVALAAVLAIETEWVAVRARLRRADVTPPAAPFRKA